MKDRQENKKRMAFLGGGGKPVAPPSVFPSLAIALIISLAIFSGCGDPGTTGGYTPAVQSPVTTAFTDTTCGDSVAEPVASETDAVIRRDTELFKVKRGVQMSIKSRGISLTATKGSVLSDGEYSVTPLYSEELPPLPQGMENMTAGVGGYRRPGPADEGWRADRRMMRTRLFCN